MISAEEEMMEGALDATITRAGRKCKPRLGWDSLRKYKNKVHISQAEAGARCGPALWDNSPAHG